MRTIRISGPVWDEIAARGKFGETPDDVLRRVFGIDQSLEIGQRVESKFPESSEFEETPSEPPARTVQTDYSSNVGRSVQHIRSRQIHATRRMTSGAENGYLNVSFQNGPSEKWLLPSKTDKLGIRAVRDKAVEFAEKNGATIGQANAVRKALTSAGYHLTK